MKNSFELNPMDKIKNIQDVDGAVEIVVALVGAHMVLNLPERKRRGNNKMEEGSGIWEWPLSAQRTMWNGDK